MRLGTAPGSPQAPKGPWWLSSSRGLPWSGNRQTPVAVAGGAYRVGVEQLPVLAGPPRSAPAVVAEDLPPARRGGLALDPTPGPVPPGVAQGGGGCGAH